MTEKQLSDPPKPSDLMNYVGAKALDQWRSIAVQLGLDRDEVKAMSTSSGENTTEHLTEVFDRWNRQMTKPYTWECLIHALEQPTVDCSGLADVLRRQFASQLGHEPLLSDLLNFVAPHVQDKWRLVGQELGIDAAQLNGLSAPDKTKVLNCYQQVFDMWKIRAKPKYPYTWSFLISVLRSPAVKCQKIAEELEAKLGQQQLPSTTIAQQPPELKNEKPAYGVQKFKELQEHEIKNVAVKVIHDKFVQRYCKEVQIVLQAANDTERLAIFSKLMPPVLYDGTKSDQIVRFSTDFQGKNCSGEYTLGMFGGYKAALVHTEQGQKCRSLIEATIGLFSNVRIIIGVGVAYGSSEKCTKLGDVLISEKIAELDTIKYKKDGSIISRGIIGEVKDNLRTHFCKGSTRFIEKFACTEGTPPRFAKTHVGCIISGSFLVDNEEIKLKLWDNATEAIGGEMEGHVLMDIIKQRDSCKFKAIIIKGVCDYGDGTKEKNWQLTAALAAVEYTHFRLELTQETLFTGGYGDAPIEDMRSEEEVRVRGDKGNDFPAVSGDQLGEDNLVDVIEEVMDVAARWRSVGLALRLRVAELDTISSKNHTDPNECLKDMLLAWVQQHYNINEFGPPSWRLLCQAIFKKAGGNNPALARKIAEHHRGRAH